MRPRPQRTQRRRAPPERERPTLPSLGPETATVVLALLAALTWGVGDFGGGITSRRAPVLGVVLIVELVGVALAVSVALVTHEPWPSPAGIAIALGAGSFGTIGILGLYRGLAVGRMGIVAPVAAVLGASVPVAAGLMIEGLPGPLQLLGIAIGIVAVILVSRVPGPAGGRSGIEFALAAGVGIGGFNVLIGQLPDGEVLWPLVALRLMAVPIMILIIVLGGQAWRVPRGAIWPAVAVGTFDMVGNLSFLLAAQVGALAIAALIASFYPVITIVLAIAILGERVTPSHAFGIAMAVAAIALIAAG
jgi:drug/metabolite transporter (DMT)-like permease